MDKSLEERMLDLGIDVDRSTHILTRYNNGAYDGIEPVSPRGIPRVDGTSVVDRTGPVTLTVDEDRYHAVLADIAPEIPADRFGTRSDGKRRLEEQDLETIGVLLYPYLSYGVLNGGSATSYADRRKNQTFDPHLFKLYHREFDELAPWVTGKPKGITPAWVNPDGSPGASFLELKFRMLLLSAERYHATASRLGVAAPENLPPVAPFFEMTSYFTEPILRETYRAYESSPLLSEFDATPELLHTEHAVQPLLAAMSHSDLGRPKTFFTEAYGKPGEPLGIPGGHGQNFQVLSGIYRDLLHRGKRFVYLGNVDNLGFTIDPVSLAFTALRRAPAAFDFAFRTALDVKGGVLVYDQNDNMNCADIGAAISKDEVFDAEARGEKILFNCATGLFDLRHLCGALDDIMEHLPMRVSDQDKDASRYSQAEQVTWEVIAMLDSPIVFGIDKYRRFLAAKMLLDTLLTSGLYREDAATTQPTVYDLERGLHAVLAEEYGLRLADGRWVPE